MPSAPSRSILVGALAAAGTLVLAAEPALAQAMQVQEAEVTTHRSQGPVTPVDGASARLARTEEGIFASLDTRGLAPGHAYTLLLAVMNDPGACEATPCPPSDVVGRTNEVQADIVGAADGTIVGEDGRARFATFQPVGELPGAWFGNGLQNPQGAEVHLVVVDHGPFLPEVGRTMVTSYRGGCTDESIPGAFPEAARAGGEPGPNACRMMQVAASRRRAPPRWASASR